MRIRFFKHASVAVATSATVVLFAAGVASAHIDPDPIAMQAGRSATVAFKVEHGCDGSPTMSMKFEIPAGVTDAVGVEKEGWTSTVTGNVLEFTGGPLDPEQEDHFDITFTAPTAAGEIHFPVIQTCEVGELAWIEIPAEGAAEPERPAPTIKVTEGAPTPEDLTPAPEEEEGTEDTLVTQSTDGAAPTATAVPADDKDDDDSNTGTIVILVIGAAIVLAGGGVMLARRNKPTPQP
jgi:periplasmic copper chaperone A